MTRTLPTVDSSNSRLAPGDNSIEEYHLVAEDFSQASQGARRGPPQVARADRARLPEGSANIDEICAFHVNERCFHQAA
jgi:hypothetical protein